MIIIIEIKSLARHLTFHVTYLMRVIIYHDDIEKDPRIIIANTYVYMHKREKNASRNCNKELNSFRIISKSKTYVIHISNPKLKFP